MVRMHRLAAGLVFLAAACGSSTNNAPPRVSPIPQQVTAGATVFSLDLDEFVTDREGTTVAFAVLSGGGSFAGSVYSHTFDTMGTYTVRFRATDGHGLRTDAEFSVQVTTANLAVVRVGTSGLKLLDTDTNMFVTVAASSPPPSLACALGRGQCVYQLDTGSGNQLWVFDLFARQNTRIAPAAADATLRAKTSDDRLVFTTGSGAGSDLWFHNPATGLTREISATIGEADGNPMVNVAGLVFYERGNGGQNDVYFYDPSTDNQVAVATSARDERVLAVLPDGGAVLSRVGDGGEIDLFYFRVGIGLVEIGLDQPALGFRHKVWHGAGSDSRVVFSAANGADNDLWSWNPANGQTTAVATGAVYGFEAVSGTKVVYREEVSATEHDLLFRDLATGTSATLRADGDVSALLALTVSGGVTWATVQGSTTPSTVTAVRLLAAPTTVPYATGGALELGGVLPNGDVIVQRVDGSELVLFDASAATWAPVAGTGLAFAGAGADTGDFLFTATAAAQTDLYLWDESAGLPAIVSDLTGDDAFQAVTADGKVLFTHVYTGKTTRDLAVWDPAGPTVTRLTDLDELGQPRDHAVLGVYSGAR